MKPKYVRLRNTPGIISYDDDADDLDKPMVIHYPSEVVKEADTIVEVCDVIVVLLENNTHRLYDFDAFGCKSRLERTILVAQIREKYKDNVIYGAIWFDKGLAYVAQVNDEGALELL